MCKSNRVGPPEPDRPGSNGKGTVCSMWAPPMPHEWEDCDSGCVWHDHTVCVYEGMRRVGRKIAEEAISRRDRAFMDVILGDAR